MKKLLLFATCLLAALSQAAAVGDANPDATYSAKEAITSISVSERLVAAGSEDNDLRIFDPYLRSIGSYRCRDKVKAVDASDDYIAVGSADNTLTLLDHSGRLIWERELETYVEYPHALSIGSDLVAAGTRDGFLYVFDSEGTLKWREKTDSYVIALEVMSDSIVVVSDKRLHVFTSEGARTATVPLDSYVRAAHISDHYVLVGLGNNRLLLYGVDGSQKWASEMPDQIGAGAVHAAGTQAVAGLKDGSVYLFSLNGSVRWRKEFPDSIVALATDGEQVLAATRNDTLYLMNANGSTLWEYPTSGRVRDMQKTPAGTFVGTSEGDIYYFSPTSRIPMSFFMMVVSAAVLIAAFAVFLRAIR
jgi:outer membrane protein assembly factor BamB